MACCFGGKRGSRSIRHHQTFPSDGQERQQPIEMTHKQSESVLDRFHLHDTTDPTITETSRAYGTLHFSSNDNKAPFLCLSKDDSPTDALEFVEAMMNAGAQHRFVKPNLVLSVTGGATSFALSRHLEEALTKGISNVVRRTNAWVVTGGTHTGVMRLTGSIMDSLYKSQKNIASPTIGIATLGVLAQQEALLKGATVNHDLAGKSKGVNLDPNHTCFLLVDDGSRGKFGVEIPFRAKLEKAIFDKCQASIISIVIQGGVGTLDTAFNAVKERTPLVVVNHSGGAADVIAYAYYLFHGEGSEHSSLSGKALVGLVKKAFKPKTQADLNKILQRVFDCVLDRKAVFVFDLHQGGPEEFENQIFEAIISTNPSLKTTLTTAMLFDRMDVVTRRLNEQHVTEEETKVLSELLRTALSSNKPEFAKLLLNAGASVTNVNPKKSPVAGFLKAIEELYEEEAEHNSETHLVRLVQLSYTNTRGRALSCLSILGLVDDAEERSNDGEYNVARMSEILWSLVGYSDEDLKAEVTSHLAIKGIIHEEAVREKLALNLLFLWAVCLDRFDLARTLWLRIDRPVMKALVASRILAAMSAHAALSGTYLAEERKIMTADSRRFEDLAVGVLDQGFNDDTDKTEKILKPDDDEGTSPVHVAYVVSSLRFLAHPATQKLLQREWTGNIGKSLPFFAVALGLLVPCSVPLYLYIFQPPADIQEKGAERTDDKDGILNDSRFDKFMREGARVADTAKKAVKRPISLGSFVYRFYMAPSTSFVSDALSHIALCLLFSFYVMDEIATSITAVDGVLIAWFLAFVCEEIRQMYDYGIRNYVSILWNQLDLTLLGLYISGLVVRVVNLDDISLQLASRGIHTFVAVALWVRLMRYYAVSATLGPKLIMIAEMTKDILAFVCFLVVFILAYGVAAQALLFPAVPFSAEKVINVLYRPYFQMYGELDLEGLQADSGCMGDLAFSQCPREEVRLLPVFFAVYMLIANILLINLLIAMFNDTYARVKEEAETLWRKQNYELLDEYRHKPLLPAPLSLIAYVVRLALWAGKHVHKCTSCCGPTETTVVVQPKRNEFEATCAERHVEQTDKQAREAIQTCVLDTNRRVAGVQDGIHAILDRLAAFQAVHERHMTHLRNATGPNHNEPDLGLSRSNSVSSLQDTPSTNKRFGPPPPVFIPSRKYPVADDDVTRCSVDLDCVPWIHVFPDYSPVEYTHSSVLLNPNWADPTDPKGIGFNEKMNGVDRTSCGGEYEVDRLTGRPRHPRGRTGMTGRGLLGKWGVNQAGDTVVTRWRRACDGSIMERDGKRVLEFLAIRRPDNGMWAIPGGFVDNGEEVIETLGRKFLEETMDKATTELTDDERHAVQQLLSGGVPVARIYSEDERNTDNAWVETTCINFHDATGHLSSKLEFKRSDENLLNVAWLPVLEQLGLFASHSELLRRVARHHDAYF
ncbi:ADP-ribose pyrophosphatase [Salpingoeca rosetta]|uniref:ADP-ribose pyrophosphatase n=1 Tax=Salpingoeca rosetta (strain ATCC 50818 / BSB-021) TaxID=946362 RepID=F2U348_SALR5|nr:ADP-ribose pyrophosphatase [Salpingoeca rosetta]EGD82042.1 ADP-ribose pyrophosphatase [Salpingoeca rosetta]|eukprot:XP_004996225.1 ADP-ribose pyrophosphatase [Salpingoeca rosetta]